MPRDGDDTAEPVAVPRPLTGTDSTKRIRYEVVFDCRDRVVGDRLCANLEEGTPTTDIRRVEEGPTWSLGFDFPNGAAAEEFFGSEAYRQFCIEVRRSCRSSVLVVPLGPTE